MKIRDLQVNHLSKPCGIDGSDITLRWKLEDGSQMQYHLSQKIPYRTTGKLELL